MNQTSNTAAKEAQYKSWKAAQRLINVLNQKIQKKRQKQANKWGFDFANLAPVKDQGTQIAWTANSEEALTA